MIDTSSPTGSIEGLLARRTAANAAFFEAEAERTAHLCHRMAERFARGGRLVALGRSPQARSDARHVAVEFVHPVIVGKRALPALGLAPEGGVLPLQARLILRSDDIVLGFEPARDESGETMDALDIARQRGCLVLAYGPVEAEWAFDPPSEDPFVRQEVIETHYHLLWELVHVFFEHRGLLEGRAERRTHDPGESRFLYPFLGEHETDRESVIDDVRQSILLKSEEIGRLREQTLADGAATLRAAAADLLAAFGAGGTLLALGNGGSATDAMDVAADFRAAPQGWPARPVLDLTEDAAILTALANDIGTDALFARQIIAYARPGDAVLALSTSGDSRNVIEALAEARRREVRTIACVGYDGGRVAAEGLADHVIVTRSEHVPRIQEAQASACHVLRELVEVPEVEVPDPA